MGYKNKSQGIPGLVVWILASGFVAIVLCLVYYLIVVKYFPTMQERAEFGELFGGLVAFFTALAFGAVTWTMILQRRDLNLQLAELMQTRQEMVAQTKSFNQQSFEMRFFEWLKLHHNIVDGMDIQRGEEVIYVRRDCFRYFYSALHAEYVNQMRSIASLPPAPKQTSDEYIKSLVSVCNNKGKDQKQILISAYLHTYQQFQGDLGHYFRNLYNLIKFVDQSDSTEKDKYFYVKVIRAQLSSNELIMLFYNCLSSMGREKFYPLVEKYSLLKNMNFELLLHASHKGEYSAEAYGST